MEVILESTIKCPNCGHEKTEEMPTGGNWDIRNYMRGPQTWFLASLDGEAKLA